MVQFGNWSMQLQNLKLLLKKYVYKSALQDSSVAKANLKVCLKVGNQSQASVLSTEESSSQIAAFISRVSWSLK